MIARAHTTHDPLPQNGEEDTPHQDEAWLREEMATMRLRQRRRRLQRWRSLSWTAWLMDSNPEDLYSEIEFRRSAEQEARRQWLRAHTSWSFLGRYQTLFGTKLALSLPICMALIQVIPELRGRVPIHIFGWCYLAGLCWLTALLLYQWRSPRLLKATMSTYAGLSGAPRRQLLCAFVEAELDELVHTRIWTPQERRETTNGMEERAIGLMAYGCTPALEGFGLWAQTLIERAIYEWAKREQVQLLMKGHDKFEILGRRLAAGYECGVMPAVDHLHLRHPFMHEIEAQPFLQSKDLILEWRRAPLQSLEHRDQMNRSMQRHLMAEGLARLFEHDAAAESMASIVAQWSNWKRPFSRMAIAGLYASTLVCAGTFLFMQTRTILLAMLH